MHRRWRGLLIGLGVIAIAATTVAPAAPDQLTASAGTRGRAVPLIEHIWKSLGIAPPTIHQCQLALGIKCYQPREIRNAYDLPALYSAGLTGKGRTIVIVDSFGSPTIGDDLKTFDARFTIPAPPSFMVLQPAGPVPPFDPSNGTMVGWAFETTLDVEWAHTVAPGANIVLVETPSAETEGIVGVPEMIRAENFVINHSIGDVISQSWGATEQTFASPDQLRSQRSAYMNALHHGVTVLASSGDSGAANVRFSGNSYYPFPTLIWPASDPLVTAVGATDLNLNSAGDRLAPDVVAHDTHGNPCCQVTGGGPSAVFGRPDFQNSVRGVVGDARGIPDISMSGACEGAVLVWLTFVSPGWYPICGSSESSPLFAGIVAIASQKAGHRLGFINPALYQLLGQPHSGVVDVTKGNNTVTVCTADCSGSHPTMTTVHGFSALDGYDMASGVGTIDAPDFVGALAASAG